MSESERPTDREKEERELRREEAEGAEKGRKLKELRLSCRLPLIVWRIHRDGAAYLRNEGADYVSGFRNWTKRYRL